MAVTVTTPLVEYEKVTQNRDGYTATVGFLVEGLSPTAPGLVLGGTYNNSNGSGTVTLPTWAAAHPYLIGTYCTDVTQSRYLPKGKTSLLVLANYGPAELVTGLKITVTGSNGTKTLSFDQNGSPYFPISYTPPDDGSGDAPPTLKDYGVASYLAPGSIVTFERDEYVSAWSKIQAYKSCTNSATFLGYPTHAVICRDIEQESFVSATRWHVRYIFEIDPSPLGFQQTFLFHDQYTGKVPGDVTGTMATGTSDQNGILVADPYQKLGLYADFNQLDLPTSLLTG